MKLLRKLVPLGLAVAAFDESVWVWDEKTGGHIYASCDCEIKCSEEKIR